MMSKQKSNRSILIILLNKGVLNIVNDKEKQYWEDYVSYWLDKVKESNEHNHNKKDTTVDDQMLFKYVSNLGIEEEDRILDYGCGFCRLYPFIKEYPKKGVEYWGVDIAQAPLNYALQLYPELQIQLKTLNELRIPYKKDTFDKVVCFGVLDACHQEETIYDIISVLKVGGKALITGKNSDYHSDDELAMIAEINARKKEHPNYFTQVRNLIQQLKARGIAIEKIHYFERRGDFTEDKYTTDIPEYFYEYAMIIKKEKEIIDAFIPLASKYSNTYRKKYSDFNE